MTSDYSYMKKGKKERERRETLYFRNIHGLVNRFPFDHGLIQMTQSHFLWYVIVD